jgi:folate-binding protein YgfZ
MSEGYTAAREGAALLAPSERGVLAVTGPDRQKFLHSMLSNDVKDRAPGQGTLAALMDAKGHLLALLRVLVTNDAVLLELPQSRVKPVEQVLLHYKVGSPVRFAERPTSVLALLGPKAPQMLEAIGMALPGLEPQSHVTGTLAGAPVLVSPASDLPSDALVLHVALEAAAAVAVALRAAGATPLERADFDALRIEQGRPLYGVDVSEDNLLHETGLVAEYHSPTKGCYVGQETIARLEARGGNVNKSLRGLRLGAPAEPGSPITADGRAIGVVTTAAVSPRLGPIAMGYVHRNQAAPGTVVEVAGVPASVEGLPLTI